MKAARLAASLVGMFCATTAYSGDWYDDVGTQMGQMEQFGSGGEIWLSTPNASVLTVAGHAGSCQVNTIRFIPPSGKEREWLALILAANLAQRQIKVYGDCDQGNYRIDVSRVAIVYH